ncbi:MAG: DUF4340 domain-containing protein [Erysipelotrichaceae bacterium]
MAKTKRLKSLFILFIALCLVTLGISLYEQKKEDIKNKEETIISIENEDIQTVSWVGDKTLKLQKKEDRWVWSDDEDFPIDSEKVEKLLNNFNDFGSSFVIVDVEDYSQYGLDDPVLTINITSADRTYQIKFGDYSKMDEKRYVDIGDGSVYLVSNDLSDDFNINEEDLFLYDEIPSIKKATNIKDNSHEIVYIEDDGYSYNKDDVYYLKDKSNYYPLDTTNVEKYLKNNVTYLNLDEYVSYTASSDDLSQYGLDNPYNTVSISYIDEDDKESTINFYLGRTEEDEQKLKEDEDYTYSSYLRIDNSEIIYKLPSGTAGRLQEIDYDSLRSKDVVRCDLDDIYQLDIELEGEYYSFIYDDKKWKLNDEEVDTDNLKDRLEDLEIDSFNNEQINGKLEIGFTFYLNDDNYDTVTVKIYRVDSSNCLAVVDNKTMGYVSRSAVIDLIEEVNVLILN